MSWAAAVVSISPRQRRWIFALISAVMAVAASGLVAVNAFRPAAAATSTSLPLATARRGEFLVTVTCRGELVADQSVQIVAPNVPNLSIVWLAPANSPVKEGDPVVRFDVSGAQRQLKEKEAAFAEADATSIRPKPTQSFRPSRTSWRSLPRSRLSNSRESRFQKGRF